MKDGKWGRFRVDGSLKQEEIYKLGKLIEVSDFYLSDGNVFKNETFDSRTATPKEGTLYFNTNNSFQCHLMISFFRCHLEKVFHL